MKKILVIVFVITIGVIGIFIYNNQQTKRHLPKTLQIANDFCESGSYDSSAFYADIVLIHAKNSNNRAFAHALIGYSYLAKTKYDSALISYKKSIEESLRSDSTDYALQVNSLIAIGVIFEKYELYKKSIEYLTQASEIAESHHLSTARIAYYNLAYNQSKLNDITCVKSYYRALEFASEFKDPIYESYCLNDLGLLMLGTDNFESAKEYFNMALANNYTQTDKQFLSYIYIGLGQAEFGMNNFNESENFLNKSLELQKETNDQQSMFSSYQSLAKLYVQQNDLTKAEAYYGKAIAQYEFADLTRENISVFRELSKIQSQLNKHEESEQNNYRHYQEIDRYLDAKEKAAAIAIQDEFNMTVSIDEAQFRHEHAWMLLDKWDKNFFFVLKFIPLLLGIYLARRVFLGEYRLLYLRLAWSK